MKIHCQSRTVTTVEIPENIMISISHCENNEGSFKANGIPYKWERADGMIKFTGSFE